MMNRADLFRPAPPWLGQWVADYTGTSRLIWSLRTESSLSEPFVAIVRGRKMRRRQGAFDQFAASLQFPYYFGENWNALADCVRDLDWLRADAFVIVVLDAVEALADGDPDEFGLMLKILSMGGEEWSRADEFRGAKPFHTLLHVTPGQVSALWARLMQASMTVPVLETEPS